MEDDKGETHNPPNHEPDEEIPYDFQCCVCLDLLYKPVVLPCGHISCFWCVFTAMARQSQCPMCRHPYYHFPSICQLLNSVLLQLYPIAYKRRERQIAKREERSQVFSPQFDNHLSASKPGKELTILVGTPPHSATSSFGVSSIGSCSTGKEKSSSIKGLLEDIRVSIKDLICAVCEELLYRPVVLNCGHVYCEACIISPDNVSPKCQVCGSIHPNGYLKVCLILEHFLEKQFFEHYGAKKKAVVKQVDSENGSGASSPIFQTNASQLSSHFANRHVPGVKIHNGYGCDYCGMFPIIGERYNCTDCRERAGFDLCQSCYSTPAITQGRFNQQHKPNHNLEIVQPTYEHDDDTETEDDIIEDIYPDGTSEENNLEDISPNTSLEEVSSSDRGLLPDADRIALMTEALRYSYQRFSSIGFAAGIQYLDHIFEQLQIDPPQPDPSDGPSLEDGNVYELD